MRIDIESWRTIRFTPLVFSTHLAIQKTTEGFKKYDNQNNNFLNNYIIFHPLTIDTQLNIIII